MTYDPNGNLLTLTDAKNQTTTYTYDNMDRLATRKDALNRQESYQYDLASNLTTFTDRKNQVTTFQYDPLDRRTLTSYADSTTVGVTYDAVGNVTKLTDSASGSIDWTYDVLDRVTQEATPQGIVRYTYDAISQRLTMRANAQQPVTYNYDPNSQLSQVTQGTLSATLTHDALGRRTQLQRSNGVTTTYNYDPASRLLGITHAKGATVLEQFTHGFDQADNKNQVTQLVQTATALPPAVTAAYNALNQQTQFASATVGYDSNGNLTTDGTNTYTWDARDRLIGISGGTTSTFSYDALDRRIAKTINGGTSTYLYDGADVITEAGASNASYLSTLNIDEPIVRQTPGENEFYLANDLGSTVALTNDAGAVTTTYTYGPFGTTTVDGSSTNPFQFTGRENDGNGLYYYRARYYSPSHGRFLAEDPLEFGGGDINLYAYVWNAPVNFSDAFGLAVKAPGQIPPGCEPPKIGKRKNLIQRALHNLGCADSLLPSGGLNMATAVTKAAGKAARGARPPNLSPPGAGRQGAFNQAKRDAGIPTSQQPVRTRQDRNGNREYDFEVPTPYGGAPKTVTIRDDARGHNFGPNDPQNRGPHFNGPKGTNTHYEY